MSITLGLLCYLGQAGHGTAEGKERYPGNVVVETQGKQIFTLSIHEAVSVLNARDSGRELLKGPLGAKGDVKQGERIWYFKTPWGAFMEILWRPEHLGYEKQTENRLYQPHDSWSADR